MRVCVSFVITSLALGCSDSSSATPASADDAGTLQGADADTALDHDPRLGTDTQNPYGAAYPTEHLGWRSRLEPQGQPAQPGSVIPNRTWRGLTPWDAFADVPLSTFHDPEGRTHSLVVLVAGPHTIPATAATVRAFLDPPIARVAVVAVLGGSGATPPADAEVKQYRAESHATFALVDTAPSTLAPIWDQSTSPMIIMLDARTMEIVYAAASFLEANVVEAQRDAVEARSPSY